jgi:hypothetical protein
MLTEIMFGLYTVRNLFMDEEFTYFVRVLKIRFFHNCSVKRCLNFENREVCSYFSTDKELRYYKLTLKIKFWNAM